MLNLSKNSIYHRKDWSVFSSFQSLRQHEPKSVLIRLMIIFFVIFIIMAFVPWTQNIATSGKVTTLVPENRPQTMQSIISGRIEKWYVAEGDLIKKGDTIVQFSEVKTEYFDPNLVGRTQNQIDAKANSQRSYRSKVENLSSMIAALQSNRRLKFQEAQFKIQQNRQKLEAAQASLSAKQINLQTKRSQYNRTQNLQAKGLKSVTELENKRNDYEKAEAEQQEAQNKLSVAQTELANSQNYAQTVLAEYDEKIAKAQSTQNETQSATFKLDGEIAKMQNQYENYKIRNDLYFLIAPQDGFVSKLYVNGIGEMVKEGQPVMHLAPANLDAFAEIYVSPMDLPLVQSSQEVLMLFDGWPSIVFSGWPKMSVGVFKGEVISVENFLSDNGMYRVLVKPSGDKPWPEQVRMGAGLKAFMMLRDVPIWYELWRQLNGFPRDFYTQEMAESDTKGNKKKK